MNTLQQVINFENLTVVKSLACCFLMAFFYVSSLYLWGTKKKFDRDEPEILKRRFTSVFITCFVCVIFVYSLAQVPSPSNKNVTNDRVNNTNTTSHCLYEWIGLKFDLSVFTSFLIGIILSAILFAGPIVQDIMNCYLDYLYVYENCDNVAVIKNTDLYKSISDFKFTPEDEQQINQSISNFRLNNQRFYQYLLTELKSRFSKESISNCMSDLVTWRNFIVCPLTEEFVFRGCMIPLVYPFLGQIHTCIVVPLFFGVAHLHHIIEGYFFNEAPLDSIVLQHLFQFSYTYVFGIYSSYLFLRTGSIFPAISAHMFCNYMGFPNISDLISDFQGWIKNVIFFFYVLGFVAFFCSISYLTEPNLYNNSIYV